MEDYLAKWHKLRKGTYACAQFGGFCANGNIKNASKINQEAMNYYREILYEISSLAFKLGLKTNIELAYLFQFLLTNGYLSVRQSYQESTQINPILPSGMAIMSGTASEFNQSAMLENLFETCHREAYMIAVSQLKSFFRIYSTQVIFPAHSQYYTFDSGRNLYGTSDKRMNSITPDGTKLKFSPSYTRKISLNNIHMSLIKANSVSAADIKETLRFSDGNLKAFSANAALAGLHNFLEQNRGFIEEFYRCQYHNISKVAEFVSSVR